MDSQNVMLSWDELCRSPQGVVDALNRVYLHDVMQYTGLKDRNNVEIFEGDILSSGRTTLIYQVEWDIGEVARFVGVCAEPEKDFALMSYSWGEAEIIGNIYEHKHLLESDNE